MTAVANEILVWSEQSALQAALLAEARKVADESGYRESALMAGSDADEVAALGSAGADVVYRVDTGRELEGDTEAMAAVLLQVVQQVNPRLRPKMFTSEQIFFALMARNAESREFLIIGKTPFVFMLRN